MDGFWIHPFAHRQRDREPRGRRGFDRGPPAASAGQDQFDRRRNAVADADGLTRAASGGSAPWFARRARRKRIAGVMRPSGLHAQDGLTLRIQTQRSIRNDEMNEFFGSSTHKTHRETFAMSERSLGIDRSDAIMRERNPNSRTAHSAAAEGGAPKGASLTWGSFHAPLRRANNHPIRKHSASRSAEPGRKLDWKHPM